MMPTGTNGESELERVMRQQSGRPATLRSILPAKTPPGLGYTMDYGAPDFDPSVEGRVPGLTYSGGPQTQWTGPKGRLARKYDRRYEALFGEVDRSKCPEWLTEECLDVVSRLLEQTFRNFQLVCRRPSHIDPPFVARPIDRFNNTAVNLAALGAFTNIVSFTMPTGRHRGVIVAAGQGALQPAAFNDVEWRVLVDGTPETEYTSIRLQLWEFVPPTPLFTPIHLRNRQTVTIQARNLSGTTAFDVHARLVGWFYPTRAEIGERIGSTIVD